MRRAMRWGIILIIVGCILGVGYWWYQTRHTYELVISHADQPLPTQLTLVRGVQDVLVIKNASTSPVTVAGTTLAPGQQLRHYYRSTGEYTYACSVHNGQTLHISVRDP